MARLEAGWGYWELDSHGCPFRRAKEDLPVTRTTEDAYRPGKLIVRLADGSRIRVDARSIKED